MLCEKCNKNQATFHYAEVINGVRSEHHLCSECAANTDVSFYSSIFENDENFTRLISGILGGKAIVSGNGESDKSVNVTCPNCKTTYGEFVKNSRFGCPVCYDIFGLLISDKMKKIHGSKVYMGKKPMKYGKPEEEPLEYVEREEDNNLDREIEILRKKLKSAVEEEDFEEAARLRDLIAELSRKEGKNA